jgi:signal transduction histidine kinase
MISQSTHKHPIVREIILIVFFGILSFLFNKIRFSIPGLENVTTDLKEVPLLISVFHVSNPFSLLVIYFITSIETITQTEFIPSYAAHAVSLVISWYFFKFIRKKNFSIVFSGITSFFYILFYYMALLMPSFIFINLFIRLHSELNFFTFYKSIFKTAQLEIFTTSLITSLYYVQLKTRNKLLEHEKELEQKIKTRTEELENTNEELINSNDELFHKNRIIEEQNAELKRTMQKLEEAQIKLIQTEKNASLGVLISGITHEINNPLNYIQGAYFGFQKRLKELDIESERFDFLLSSIQTGVDKIAKIVKGLTEFSGSEGDTFYDCDVHTILENCLTILHNELLHKIKIEKNFTNKKTIIKGNKGKLHQVFLNILKNSIQAIEGQGAIEISTKIEKGRLLTSISDNGHGIIQSDIIKITDPFFTTKEPGAGTGLGLTITKQIVEDHNGFLECDSVLNKGTKITVILPLKKAEI